MTKPKTLFDITAKKRRKIIRLAKNTNPQDHIAFNKLAMRKYKAFIKKLAESVRARRESLGMSQTTLAKRIGIHLNTVYRLESCGKVGADSLFQVCTYLDIEIMFKEKPVTGERKYAEVQEEESLQQQGGISSKL